MLLRRDRLTSEECVFFLMKIMSAFTNMAAHIAEINAAGNMIKFVTSISSRHVEHWTVSQFIKHAEAHKPMTVFEYLQDDVLTKPYFDYERYYDEEPSANGIYSVLSGLKYCIRDCFRGEDDFDETKQVAYAQRHGWVAKPTKENPDRRQFKASFRAYVLGYAIRYTQMPHFIREHAVGWDFDQSTNLKSNCMAAWGDAKAEYQAKGRMNAFWCRLRIILIQRHSWYRPCTGARSFSSAPHLT